MCLAARCQVELHSVLRKVILQLVQQILLFVLQYEQYSCEVLSFILSIHFVVLPFI